VETDWDREKGVEMD
jgi:hypothetical protein